MRLLTLASVQQRASRPKQAQQQVRHRRARALGLLGDCAAKLLAHSAFSSSPAHACMRFSALPAILSIVVYIHCRLHRRSAAARCPSHSLPHSSAPSAPACSACAQVPSQSGFGPHPSNRPLVSNYSTHSCPIPHPYQPHSRRIKPIRPSGAYYSPPHSTTQHTPSKIPSATRRPISHRSHLTLAQ